MPASPQAQQFLAPQREGEQVPESQIPIGGPFSAMLTQPKYPEPGRNAQPTGFGGPGQALLHFANNFLAGASQGRLRAFQQSEQAKREHERNFDATVQHIMDSPKYTQDFKEQVFQQALATKAGAGHAALEKGGKDDHPLVGLARSLFTGIVGPKDNKKHVDIDATHVSDLISQMHNPQNVFNMADTMAQAQQELGGILDKRRNAATRVSQLSAGATDAANQTTAAMLGTATPSPAQASEPVTFSREHAMGDPEIQNLPAFQRLRRQGFEPTKLPGVEEMFAALPTAAQLQTAKKAVPWIYNDEEGQIRATSLLQGWGGRYTDMAGVPISVDDPRMKNGRQATSWDNMGRVTVQNLRNTGAENVAQVRGNSAENIAGIRANAAAQPVVTVTERPVEQEGGNIAKVPFTSVRTRGGATAAPVPATTAPAAIGPVAPGAPVTRAPISATPSPATSTSGRGGIIGHKTPAANVSVEEESRAMTPEQDTALRTEAAGSKTLDLDAWNYMLTGKLTVRGMSKMTQASIRKIKHRGDQIMSDLGLEPGELLSRGAELKGNMTAFSKLTTQGAQIGAFEGTLLRNADLAKTLSAEFKRGNIQFINRVIGAFKTGTGDKEALNMAAQLHGLSREWAKIMAGSVSAQGVPISEARQTDELISKGIADGQLDSLIDTVMVPDAKNRTAAFAAEKATLLGAIRGTTGSGTNPLPGATIRYSDAGKAYNIPASAEADFLRDHPQAQKAAAAR